MAGNTRTIAERTPPQPELIENHGYPVQIHEVQTDDGYLLTLHRVPHGRVPNTGPGKKRPVLIMHGLLSSSGDWILLGPGNSLVYSLAEEGYDVWLGNARGNRYSRKHKSLDPKSRDFWQFSWHEIGVYDLPAMIDYILARASRGSGSDMGLFYVGHSQGTTAFYVMASKLPEYNDKIHAMVSLSPVAFMYNVASPFVKLLAPFTGALPSFLTPLRRRPHRSVSRFSKLPGLPELLGGFEFLPESALAPLIGGLLCNKRVATSSICANVMFLVSGYDSQQLNMSSLPLIMFHSPSGASTKQFYHYGQLVMSGKFREYDYGLSNFMTYGSLSPPDYDLNKITAPVALLYANNDWLSSVKDVEALASKLPNLVDKYNIPFDKFNHLDFLWAMNASTLVYERVIELFRNY
ncbi:lipase 3-like [Periplaneta americana]|uniref:lipase 3-like n=1 Tax=Periplaneta americana TaxID=6978 RepID=UPI0037E7D2C4